MADGTRAATALAKCRGLADNAQRVHIFRAQPSHRGTFVSVLFLSTAWSCRPGRGGEPSSPVATGWLQLWRLSNTVQFTFSPNILGKPREHTRSAQAESTLQLEPLSGTFLWLNGSCAITGWHPEKTHGEQVLFPSTEQWGGVC